MPFSKARCFAPLELQTSLGFVLINIWSFRDRRQYYRCDNVSEPPRLPSFYIETCQFGPLRQQ